MRLMMKDQAPRQRQLDEHEEHWAMEEKRLQMGKISAACLLITILVCFYVAYSPVEASTAWQSVSDSSLVDMFGEE